MNLDQNHDLVLHTEQALLAALHACPAHLSEVSKLLCPDDFAQATHQEHYRHLTAQTQAGKKPQESTVIPTAGHSNPDNAPAYARLVLAASLRRNLARRAAHLATTARVEAAGNLGATNTLAATHDLAEALRHAAQRWGTTGPRPNHLPAPSVPAASPPTQQEDEARFLASLASHPQHIPDITRRLHPDVLTNLRHQLLYRSLAALHHRGQPIDPLTLAWEAHHQGAPAHHLTIDHVTNLTTPTTDDPYQRADRLLQAAFQRAASNAAHVIKALTTDLSLAPGELFAASELALQPVNHHQRWRAPNRRDQHTRPGPGISARQEKGLSHRPPSARSCPDGDVLMSRT
ncbi:DnaB-like helicase N-terminal domain-containing protein [Streptomyces hainanensis]|uniref:DNA helicase DnaB-like N-terminal domain-containing protein n=1 Tax=Streptomyces hainanensis TaxID=402648 RepID=A0A4V2Y2R0_9ACTN|nr:DnaB-like helicase N-terminal domain-containing protein [Streptomyces hainanensis]TDC73625.1 hypothetical protein E1283_18670 [Streptomyces hainanensis]